MKEKAKLVAGALVIGTAGMSAAQVDFEALGDSAEVRCELVQSEVASNHWWDADDSDSDGDGACGEGTCGGGSSDEKSDGSDSSGEGSCGDGSCGGSTKNNRRTQRRN
jgi:hypothetical protein